MSVHPDRLAHLLGRPNEPWPASPMAWETCLSQARRAGLHGRLAARWAVDAGSLFSDAELAAQPAAARTVPVGPALHLAAAGKMLRRLEQAMHLEAERLAAVLAFSGHRTVLLKGAAYLCAALPPARGRVFGDIDILVPRESLDKVEAALMSGGWISTELDAYNQHYYRQWMHEIPPLTHVKRGSVVDVHHTIAPPSSAFQVDGHLLLAAARPVGDGSRFWVLQPVDMVLHGAMHLFAEGEFDRGLRDLLDLHDLLRHFEQFEPEFWPTLFARAAVLRLRRPLHHALSHVERLFGPVVPAAFRPALTALRPRWLPQRVMRALLTLALRPNHPAGDTRFSGLARSLLYVRAHWLRMPPYLLVPHLVRKAWKARFRSGKRLQAAGAVKAAADDAAVGNEAVR